MKNIGIVLLLIILPVFFYAEFASSRSIFSQKDLLSRTYPFREEAIRMFKDKTLPLWNPYVLCGNPLFAAIDLGIGYPLYIFDFFMPHATAVRWNFLLHISLGGIFMYLFLRLLNLTYLGAIIGAITFMFGGYIQSSMPLPDLWINTIYIPLIFLLFERGVQKEKKIYIVFAGIALTLQILSGLPQFAYYTLLALFLYAIYYSLARDRSMKLTPIVYFIGLLSLGFLLSAFQLIPTYEYYLQSAKYNFQIAQDASTLGAMFPHAILFFIGVADPYTSGFIGITGLFLASIGIIFRRNRLNLFFGALCIFVLAAVFETTHLYKILFHIPGFNMFKSLHRFVSIYAFGISVLAGFGASTLSKIIDSDNSRLKRRILQSLLIIACILILAFSVNYLLKDRIINYGQGFIEKRVFAQPGHPFPLDYYYKKLENLYNASLKILELAILPLIGILIITVLRKNRHISSFLFRTGFICIILLELYGHWQRLDWKLVDPQEYYRPGEGISFIKKDTSIYRVFGLDNDGGYHFDYENRRKMNDLLTPNLATHHHIQDPQGNNNLTLWNYWQLLDLINKKKSPLENVYSRDPFHVLAITNPHHNLLDLLNVKYLLTYYPIAENNRWKLVFEEGVKVYQNKKVIPRAFMAYKYKAARNEGDLFQILDNQDFNLRETVVLDRDIENLIGPPSANKVKITKYSPLEIKIDTYSERPGILVLSDSFYPGWHAKVDGHPVKILRAYSIFRAIPIPGGSHEVIFRYFPLSFIAGCFISIVTVFVMFLEGVRRLIWR